MSGKDYAIIIVMATAAAIVAVVILKLLNIDRPGVLGGGVGGGVAGAIGGQLVAGRKKKAAGDA